MAVTSDRQLGIIGAQYSRIESCDWTNPFSLCSAAQQAAAPGGGRAATEWTRKEGERPPRVSRRR